MLKLVGPTISIFSIVIIPHGKKNLGLKVLRFKPLVPSCCLLLLPPLPKFQSQHNEHILNTQILNFDINFHEYRYWVLVKITFMNILNLETLIHSILLDTMSPPYTLKKVKGFSCVLGRQNCNQQYS